MTAGHFWLGLTAVCVQILKEQVKSHLHWIKCAGVARFSTNCTVTVQLSLHEDEDLIVKPSAKLCTGLRSPIISSSVSCSSQAVLPFANLIVPFISSCSGLLGESYSSVSLHFLFLCTGFYLGASNSLPVMNCR